MAEIRSSQLPVGLPTRQRAWSRPSDVDPGSSAAQQLNLLDKLADGTCTASGFAHGWWEARRASQRNGERIQGRLAELFDRIFMLLEDYEVEPDLSEPGDLSAAELSMAVRDLWRDFHRSAFSIRVVSVPSPTEAEAEAAAGAGAVGRIAAGDFGENFPMDLTYWGVERYQASWFRALKALERADDAVSCLVSSITDPANSNFVSCWPLYRSGSVVHIQNSIIFLEGIAEDFTPDEPWNFVEPRSTIDEDGNEISEWQTSMDEVREFLRSVRSWAG